MRNRHDRRTGPRPTLGEGVGPSYGAAMLAAVGAGIFAPVEEAADQWVSIGETAEPDAAGVRAYDDLYQRYRELYPALKERFAVTACEA